MKEKNPKIFINLNKALYETINSKNNKISLFNQKKQFVKNCEESKKRQAERFSEWRKRYKEESERNDE